MTLKEKFPKGQVVLAKGSDDWIGIVYEAPRKKIDDGFATMGVEVFGFEHEMGSVYCREYKPIGLELFHLILQRRGRNERQYYKGKLNQDGYIRMIDERFAQRNLDPLDVAIAEGEEKERIRKAIGQ